MLQELSGKLCYTPANPPVIFFFFESCQWKHNYFKMLRRKRNDVPYAHQGRMDN